MPRRTFRDVATLEHGVPLREAGPLVRLLGTDPLELRARYVGVRAANVGQIPDWHRAKGTKAWLFVDEVLVNPPPRAQSPSRSGTIHTRPGPPPPPGGRPIR